jgi:Rps23 Pro-64 3,4-dihydroxylase Tpa1-like proline 4-hydroxylase
VIDNFLVQEVAEAIEKEFPAYDDNVWAFYNNAIENKKTMNHWDRFQAITYRTFSYLNSPEFLDELKKMTGIQNIMSDFGLSGGGLHIHKRGGKLNVHLDYSLHPKLKLERRLNIIIYLSREWQSDWGGDLGLWSHDEVTKQPKECIKKVPVKFNRAVIFDTTQNSWHGLPEALSCPEGMYRKSLAAYYLTEPRDCTSERGKALFAPHESQKDDKEVLELIEKRSSLTTFDQVYRKN